MLYHIWILHQTTTPLKCSVRTSRCIIFGFYIKPQRKATESITAVSCIIFGFYIKPQLSGICIRTLTCCIIFGFYIKPQLLDMGYCNWNSCIIFGFYIKPQPASVAAFLKGVVSYLDSTSNHNENQYICLAPMLYHIWILHQTTTQRFFSFGIILLYHIWILHQTTTIGKA